MATNAASTTCPPHTQMPDIHNLPIPQNINVMVTPGNDTSYQPMEICCEPNRVQIVDGCYLWCELPERYFNGTDKKGAQASSSSCMNFQGLESDDRRIIGWQMNGAGARPAVGSAKQIGFWVLALSGLVYAM
ncbi:hypothetical protein F5144DRAFT_543288 [Chaetomium tenue]|uniref:Uncharacterized protein n=1 Tax=Chaetomium tenue TaxID=1854479 RepID=A0ACB7PN46_9PEZI|nr:hypothetical protein F5144DRAFT_543288 [Chaetomium globosum]